MATEQQQVETSVLKDMAENSDTLQTPKHQLKKAGEEGEDSTSPVVSDCLPPTGTELFTPALPKTATSLIRGSSDADLSSLGTPAGFYSPVSTLSLGGSLASSRLLSTPSPISESKTTLRSEFIRLKELLIAELRTVTVTAGSDLEGSLDNLISKLQSTLDNYIDFLVSQYRSSMTIPPQLLILFTLQEALCLDVSNAALLVFLENIQKIGELIDISNKRLSDRNFHFKTPEERVKFNLYYKHYGELAYALFAKLSGHIVDIDDMDINTGSGVKPKPLIPAQKAELMTAFSIFDSLPPSPSSAEYLTESLGASVSAQFSPMMSRSAYFSCIPSPILSISSVAPRVISWNDSSRYVFCDKTSAQLVNFRVHIDGYTDLSKSNQLNISLFSEPLFTLPPCLSSVPNKNTNTIRLAFFERKGDVVREGDNPRCIDLEFINKTVDYFKQIQPTKSIEVVIFGDLDGKLPRPLNKTHIPKVSVIFDCRGMHVFDQPNLGNAIANIRQTDGIKNRPVRILPRGVQIFMVRHLMKVYNPDHLLGPRAGLMALFGMLGDNVQDIQVEISPKAKTSPTRSKVKSDVPATRRAARTQARAAESSAAGPAAAAEAGDNTHFVTYARLRSRLTEAFVRSPDAAGANIEEPNFAAMGLESIHGDAPIDIYELLLLANTLKNTTPKTANLVKLLVARALFHGYDSSTIHIFRVLRQLMRSQLRSAPRRVFMMAPGGDASPSHRGPGDSGSGGSGGDFEGSSDHRGGGGPAGGGPAGGSAGASGVSLDGSSFATDSGATDALGLVSDELYEHWSKMIATDDGETIVFVADWQGKLKHYLAQFNSIDITADGYEGQLAEVASLVQCCARHMSTIDLSIVINAITNIKSGDISTRIVESLLSKDNYRALQIALLQRDDTTVFEFLRNQFSVDGFIRFMNFVKPGDDVPFFPTLIQHCIDEDSEELYANFEPLLRALNQALSTEQTHQMSRHDTDAARYEVSVWDDGRPCTPRPSHSSRMNDRGIFSDGWPSPADSEKTETGQAPSTPLCTKHKLPAVVSPGGDTLPGSLPSSAFSTPQKLHPAGVEQTPPAGVEQTPPQIAPRTSGLRAPSAATGTITVLHLASHGFGTLQARGQEGHDRGDATAAVVETGSRTPRTSRTPID